MEPRGFVNPVNYNLPHSTGLVEFQYWSNQEFELPSRDAERHHWEEKTPLEPRRPAESYIRRTLAVGRWTNALESQRESRSVWECVPWRMPRGETKYWCRLWRRGLVPVAVWPPLRGRGHGIPEGEIPGLDYLVTDCLPFTPRENNGVVFDTLRWYTHGESTTWSQGRYGWWGWLEVLKPTSHSQ